MWYLCIFLCPAFEQIGCSYMVHKTLISLHFVFPLCPMTQMNGRIRCSLVLPSVFFYPLQVTKTQFSFCLDHFSASSVTSVISLCYNTKNQMNWFFQDKRNSVAPKKTHYQQDLYACYVLPIEALETATKLAYHGNFHTCETYAYPTPSNPSNRS